MSHKIVGRLGGALLSRTEIKEADSSLGQKGSATYYIKIIEPGPGSSGIFVKENLAKSAHLFTAGTQMYIDHSTKTEEWDRPERSIIELAGKLITDAEVNDKGEIHATCEVYPSFDNIIREKWEDIGISICAFTDTDFDPDGVVPPFDSVFSVDFVTKAGAGGKIRAILESDKGKKKNMTPEQITEAIAKGLSPLMSKLEEAFKEREVKEEPKVEEDTRDHVADTYVLAESELPEVSRKRVLEAYKRGGSMADLIKQEEEYIKEATEVKVGQIKEAAAEEETVVVNFGGAN